jgi:hypothetical protein
VDISVNVLWAQVDKVDAVIDTAGIIGDVASFFEPEGSIPFVITEIAEAAGFIKPSADLLSGDPNNMLLQQTTSAAERTVVMLSRVEQLVPVVGFVGNIISLYINLKPQISITQTP